MQEQADALVPLVQGLAAAVTVGDVARAKALYAPSRVPWETIEPVAESFGDLDLAIDAREADPEPGQAWTGWHRIEKTLWAQGSTVGLAPVAAQLVKDETVDAGGRRELARVADALGEPLSRLSAAAAT